MPTEASPAEDAARPPASASVTEPAAAPTMAEAPPRLAWMDALIMALRGGSNAKQAIAAAGVATTTAYEAKRRRPAFAAEWDAALNGGAGKHPKRPPAPRPTSPSGNWKPRFLTALAESSNVSAAAKCAGTTTQKVYEMRRADPEFNRAWQAALCDGYDLLEFELLHRMRSGEVKPAATAKRGVRSYENATALRLLAAHRESALRQRAIRNNQDSEAILAALNKKLDRVREQAIAEGRIVTDDQLANDQLG